MNDFLKNENLIHKFYSPNERSLDALINHYFWFSKREFLNDPFDLGNFRKGRQILGAQQLLISYIIKGLNLNEDDEKLLLSQIPEYASCSFTRSPLNKQMWAYYAKDYSGWCLSFDARGKLQSKKASSLLPVIYVNNQLNPTKPVSNNLYGTSPFEQAINQVLCTKHKTWEHEEEKRIVLPVKRNCDGVTRQWGSFQLASITIGNKISDAYRSILTLFAKQHGIPLFEIQLSNKDFELEIK